MFLPASAKNSARRDSTVRTPRGLHVRLRKPSFRPAVEALEDRTVPTAGSVLTFGGAGSAAASDIAVDAAGDMYVTGYFAGTVDFDPGNVTAGDTLTGTGTGDLHSSDVYVAK